MAVLKMNFLSKYLGMQTNITAIIPSFSHRGFVENWPDTYQPGVKFQTIYLLHGGAGDDSDYINLTSIVRYADENQVAVVMPAAYNHFYTDDPQGPRYWKYVSKEVPALCQAYFPLSAAPEDNFVAGLSMGGYGAMKMGIMECQRFAAVLCMSGNAFNPDTIQDFEKKFSRVIPSGSAADPDMMPRISLRSMFGDLAQYKGSPHDTWLQARLNVEAGLRLPKFFFTVGDQDFALEGVEQSYHYLTSLGYETFYELVPGYAHEWDFWDLSLRKALYSWLPLRRAPIFPA